MNEKDLIAKIESLKSIKPDQEWVVLAREKVISDETAEEKRTFFFPVFSRLPFAAAAALLMIFGVFAFTQYAVVTDRRDADEADRVAREREIEELHLALGELKTARAELTKEFAELIESKPKEEVVKLARDFAPSVLEIGEKESFLMGSLGFDSEEEHPGTEKEIASLLIEDLESRTLNEGDAGLLNEARDDFEEGRYSKALRNALKIGQSNDESEEDAN